MADKSNKSTVIKNYMKEWFLGEGMPSCFHINYIILSLTKHAVVGVRAMKREGRPIPKKKVLQW